MKVLNTFAVLSGTAALAVLAYGAVTFDPATGTGFVGKGDVQIAMGWNNKQLQDNAANVKFQSVSSVVTEVSWTCTNTNNDNFQERARTTTITTAGVVNTVARERNQITGFNLTGYIGDSTSSGTTSEGPQLNSCPTNWVLTPAGDPEVISSSSSLQVRAGSGGWLPIE